MTQDELRAWQQDTRIVYARALPDGRLVGVTPMLGTGRLWVGDTVGWSQAWDYPDPERAVIAAHRYEGGGDPEDGWVRHWRAGQSDRQRPDGDPAREYVEDGTR